MWNRLTCVDPGADALTLAQAKDQLRYEAGDRDDQIGRLIKSAQALIHGPKGIGVALAASSWRLSLDCFPRVIEVPLAATEVSAVTYVALGDPPTTQTTLAASEYYVDFDAQPVRIAPMPGKTWPVTADVFGAVKVEFAAGPETPDGDLVQAMLLTITDWFAQPETLGAKPLFALPQRAKDLLARRGPGSIG